jgi:hypothetical protein
MNLYQVAEEIARRLAGICMVARVMHLFATTTAEKVLRLGKQAAVVETEST